jgi:hypothetical protein
MSSVGINWSKTFLSYHGKVTKVGGHGGNNFVQATNYPIRKIRRAQCTLNLSVVVVNNKKTKKTAHGLFFKRNTVQCSFLYPLAAKCDYFHTQHFSRQLLSK